MTFSFVFLLLPVFFEHFRGFSAFYFYSVNPFSWFPLGLDQWFFVVFFFSCFFTLPSIEISSLLLIKRLLKNMGLACLSSRLIILPLIEPCGSMIFLKLFPLPADASVWKCLLAPQNKHVCKIKLLILVRLFLFSNVLKHYHYYA